MLSINGNDSVIESMAARVTDIMWELSFMLGTSGNNSAIEGMAARVTDVMWEMEALLSSIIFFNFVN